MKNESAISHTVMRRVRAIRFLRPAFSPAALAFVLFLASLWGIGRQVWVARVFENMPSLADVPAFASFALGAFAGTELLVQALTVLAGAALIRLAADLGKALSTSSRFA